MDLKVFQPSEQEVVLRTLRTALRPEGKLQPRELRFLDTWTRIAGGAWQRSIDPEPISPAEVRIHGTHQRKRLVQLSCLAALFTCPVPRDSAKFVAELARSLSVEESAVEVLDALSRGRKMKARLITFRRMFRAMLKEAWIGGGVGGVARFLADMFVHARVDKQKLWSYRRLGLLEQGTLGREYWAHMTRLGYGMPGEGADGIPELVAYHDVGHVLAGYDTTPAGEIQQGCFQGGNRREDGFFFIQFAVLQFHQGVRLTPVAKPEIGYFDPAKVLWAIHRGASLEVDITHQWNYWPLMPLGLADVRDRCGLLPALEE